MGGGPRGETRLFPAVLEAAVEGRGECGGGVSCRILAGAWRKPTQILSAPRSGVRTPSSSWSEIQVRTRAGGSGVAAAVAFLWRRNALGENETRWYQLISHL